MTSAFRSTLIPGIMAAALATLAIAGCSAVRSGAFLGVPAPMSSDNVSTSGLPVGLDSVAIERYFPLKRFFSWTYAVLIKAKDGTTEAQDTLRVETLAETSSKSGTLSLKRSIGGTTVFEGEGTVNQSSNLISINLIDRVETIELPLRAGLEWTSGTLSARSFKVDKLVVAATTYRDLIGISYTRDGEVVAARWLAPRKGIVKQLQRTKSEAGDIEIISELVQAYTVGVAAISLSPTSTISLTPAATAAATALITMDEDGLTSQEITFSSSNQSVATIAKGGSGVTGLKAVVTAVATGSAIISARSDQDPTKIATVTVTVN